LFGGVGVTESPCPRERLRGICTSGSMSGRWKRGYGSTREPPVAGNARGLVDPSTSLRSECLQRINHAPSSPIVNLSDGAVVRASTLGDFVAGCLQGQGPPIARRRCKRWQAPIAVQVRIGTGLQVTLDHGAQAGDSLRGGRMRPQPAVLSHSWIVHPRHPREGLGPGIGRERLNTQPLQFRLDNGRLVPGRKSAASPTTFCNSRKASSRCADMALRRHSNSPGIPQSAPLRQNQPARPTRWSRSVKRASPRSGSRRGSTLR
jgi:hypothetical protein